MSWGVKCVMAKASDDPDDSNRSSGGDTSCPGWAGSSTSRQRRITAPLEAFLRNAGIILQSVGFADTSNLPCRAERDRASSLDQRVANSSAKVTNGMKKPSSRIREEIARLQEQLRTAETREAERIGRLALKAGLGEIEIEEAHLVGAFEDLATKFRKGSSAKRSTTSALASGASQGPSGEA
jgi:hypothetical protein